MRPRPRAGCFPPSHWQEPALADQPCQLAHRRLRGELFGNACHRRSEGYGNICKPALRPPVCPFHQTQVAPDRQLGRGGPSASHHLAQRDGGRQDLPLRVEDRNAVVMLDREEHVARDVRAVAGDREARIRDDRQLARSFCRLSSGDSGTVSALWTFPGLGRLDDWRYGKSARSDLFRQ